MEFWHWILPTPIPECNHWFQSRGEGSEEIVHPRADSNSKFISSCCTHFVPIYFYHIFRILRYFHFPLEKGGLKPPIWNFGSNSESKFSTYFSQFCIDLVPNFVTNPLPPQLLGLIIDFSRTGGNLKKWYTTERISTWNWSHPSVHILL